MIGRSHHMDEQELQDVIRGWSRGQPQRFNLAVIGGTGVGKSTLVNTIFGQEVAKTGVGEPVTKGVNLLVNRPETLGLYDFEGLESFTKLDDFIANFTKVYEERLAQNPDDVIHGVWYCIQASSRRFDDQQEAVVRRISAMGLPVIIVVTQTPWRPGQGIAPDARELLDHISGRNLPIVGGKPIPVSALGDDFAAAEPHGLDHLLQITLDAAPVGVRTALASAQRIDAQLKSEEAKRVVAKAVTVSGGIAATPIPVPDAPVLVAAQFEMLRRISSIYNVEVPATSLAGALAGSGATLAGRSVAGALLKLVPIAGPVINAGVAGGLTWVLGRAWTELCERDWRGNVNLNALSKAGELGSVLGTALQIWSAKRPKSSH